MAKLARLGWLLLAAAPACHPTVVLDSVPPAGPDELSGILHVEGPQTPALALAVNLTEGQVPSFQPVVVEGQVRLTWTTFGCPLESFGLNVGPVPLRDEPGDTVRVPPPQQRLQLVDDGDGAAGFEPLEDGSTEDLRRLPLSLEDQCDAMATILDARLVGLDGGDELDTIRFTRAIRLNDSQALVLRYREVEDVDAQDRFVITATTAQIHLLDLDGDPTPNDTRLRNVEALPHVGVSRLGDDDLLFAGDGEVIRYDVVESRVVSRWSHPALEGAQRIEMAVRLEGDEPSGLLLTDDGPEVWRPNPGDVHRHLLALDARGLTSLQTATVAYDVTPVQLVPVEDEILVRGLTDDPEQLWVYRNEDEAWPDPEAEWLPEGTNQFHRIFQRLGLTVISVHGPIYERTEEGWERSPLSIAPFEAISAATEVQGRVLYSAKPSDAEDGTDRRIVEAVPGVGNCAIARHTIATWAAEVTFAQRGVWALIPFGGGQNGQRLTVYLYAPQTLSPRCSP